VTFDFSPNTRRPQTHRPPPRLPLSRSFSGHDVDPEPPPQRRSGTMVTDAAAMAVVRAARPALRGAHDGVAFAAHATFLAAGYSLCAVGPAVLADPSPSGACAPPWLPCFETSSVG